MATQVALVETVELFNGAEVTIRSLPVKRLRKVMAEMNKLGDAETEEQFVDKLIEIAVLCLERNPGVRDLEDLEDELDLPTVYKVIEVCAGVKLNDPKLMEMAMEMAKETAEQDGKNSTSPDSKQN